MIGNKIISFDSLKSTNDYIKENSISLENGSIVIAKKQTSGRGRNHNTWMSEEGNLYFSFILKEDVFRNKVFKILANVSVAIIRLLEDLGIKASIKYPNDILVENKKVCGILIESYGGIELDYVIIGIGLNINQIDFKDLNNVATSLKLINDTNYEIDKILNDFVTHYNAIDYMCMGDIIEDYNKYSIVVNKKYKYQDTLYLITGIDELGNLILEKNDDKEYIKVNSISLEELI